MYGALAPGGRLVVTVPVDREARDEHRADDPYHLTGGAGAPAFFQRVYDGAAIRERLVAAVGREPVTVRWFGETAPGRYRDYERRWLAEGLSCAVDDAREILDHYREYRSWEEMPGMGVCGLAFERPPGVAPGRPEAEGPAGVSGRRGAQARPRPSHPGGRRA
jgi:hypothetical protein